MSYHPHKLLATGNRRNSRQFWLERGIALLLCAPGVNTRRIKVSNNSGGLHALGLDGCSLLQYLVQHFPVVFGKLVIARPKYLVGRDRVLLAPCTTRIFIEVFAGINSPVHGAEIEQLRTLADAGGL